MAIDRQSYELLAAYLGGNISGAQKKSVEKWVSESEEHQKFFEEIHQLWQSSGVRLQYKDLDSVQLLRELQIRINTRQRPIGKVIRRMQSYQVYWRVAASVCFLVISYFAIRQAMQGNITIGTGDQVATIYLPDSTKIWLNKHSRITYQKKFKTRAVALLGEAFLSVRKDTTDFIVTTEHTLTKVQGTAFNVKEQTDSVTLTVAEGTVKFSGSDSTTGEPAIVRAWQKAVFKASSTLQATQNDDPSFASWREQNNPAFEEEKNNPALFLTNHFTWRKNPINQSVVEGTLQNHASLAAYYNIVLEVTYTKSDGNPVTVYLTIQDTVYPGKPLSYRRRLLDILSDTKSIIIKIKSAEVTSKNSY